MSQKYTGRELNNAFNRFCSVQDKLGCPKGQQMISSREFHNSFSKPNAYVKYSQLVCNYIIVNTIFFETP